MPTIPEDPARPLTRKIDESTFAPTGFFVLRTPLYPFAELQQWGEGLTACQAIAEKGSLTEALAADRVVLRDRLRQAISRPEAAEAIFLASPDLDGRSGTWLEKPDSEKGRRIERALVRYYVRMVGRPTPFGLFAGCSVGTSGESTKLSFAERGRYGRKSRLDMDYLSSLITEIEKDARLRAVLRYFPNTSIYDAASRLRYAESRIEEAGRNHHLVAVEITDYLTHALEFAAAGVHPPELAEELVRMDPEIELDEAKAFTEELIESQLLVSELSLPVTGPEAMSDLTDRLAQLQEAEEIAASLREACEALQDFDSRPLGIPVQSYRQFAKGLKELPAKVELKTLIQVDMVKPAPEAVLGRRPLQEILRGVQLLYHLAPQPGKTPLHTFMEDFQRRYEDREVPLAEALDEEVGVGFMRSAAPSAEASPLLAGLAFPARPADDKITWTQRHGYLLRRVGEALAEGQRQIELEEDKLENLTSGERLPLPDVFSAMAILAAPSCEAIDRGEFQVCMTGVSGPSGARLLGRFCHLSPDLHAWVEKHLRAEESHQPDAVYAEVIHLPQGRIGNILFRPILREHEIPFLGRSVVPREKQIPITDLYVSVRAGRVVLRSRRLEREIVPRLTSAHNFGGRNMGLYKFLCSLQSQGVNGGFGWSWDVLDNAPFLPRVTCGQLVLARARWVVFRDEIEKITKREGHKGFRAVQAWRELRKLPRMVELVEGDNSLPIDFDNVLSVEVFANLIKNRSFVFLREIFPGPDLLVAEGPEGLFVHELVIPFEKLRAEEASDVGPVAASISQGGVEPAGTADSQAGPQDQPKASAGAVAPVRRSFPPGSEWLYAKLYCGTSSADLVLREMIGPLVGQIAAAKAVDNWFFIRYGDPDWHLRIRFRGEPDRLVREVQPLLSAAAGPLLQDGRLWRIQYDTYEREIERYGGPAGIELAEQMFQADSEAVLAIVDQLVGDEGADVRWRLTLRGIDMLLDDLGLDLAQKLATMEQVQESFWREFQGNKAFKKQLGLRFRKERESLERALGFSRDAKEGPLSDAGPLIQRSQRFAQPIAELQAREKAGQLRLPMEGLAPSFAHMHANRLLRSSARAQELVIYEFLCRLYSSQLARTSKADARSHA